MKDLVVLVADLDAQIAIAALLDGRSPSLGIRRPSYDIRQHPMRDSGCCQGASDLPRKPNSASLFSELAARVGLNRCVDAAFIKLKGTLQYWFPAEIP